MYYWLLYVILCHLHILALNGKGESLSKFTPYHCLGGFIEANMSEISLEEIQQMFSKDLDIEQGGHWKPKDCKPRWKVKYN